MMMMMVVVMVVMVVIIMTTTPVADLPPLPPILPTTTIVVVVGSCRCSRDTASIYSSDSELAGQQTKPIESSSSSHPSVSSHGPKDVLGEGCFVSSSYP